MYMTIGLSLTTFLRLVSHKNLGMVMKVDQDVVIRACIKAIYIEEILKINFLQLIDKRLGSRL